jgi:intein/homing endonuclease
MTDNSFSLVDLYPKYVINSKGEKKKFEVSNIAKVLNKETGLDINIAEKVTEDVVRIIIGIGVDEITTNYIRELVCVELTQRGLNKYRNLFARAINLENISFKLDDNFLAKFIAKQPDWGPLGYITYKRTYARVVEGENRKEEFWETIRRVVEGCYSIQKEHCIKLSLPWTDAKAQKSAQIMYEKIWNFKFLPPGRGLWMMGTDWMMGTEFIARHGSMSLNNCGFASTDDIDLKYSKAFQFVMDALMLGVGVGFDTKGAGKITIKKPIEDHFTFQLPDSREGWVEALKLIIEAYFLGKRMPKFDFSLIRSAGQPIRGFGGIASGPGPLKDMLKNIQEILEARIGQPIRSLDILDIMNLIGKCVVAGNVRRSAEIALGEATDLEFIKCKQDKEKLYSHRWASNNSIFAKKGLDYSYIADQISVNGEPGILWLENAKAYSRMGNPPDHKDKKAAGVNPCITGDTLIAVADGRNAVAIKQLAEEGNDIPVYCKDDKGLTVIRMMRNPRITGYNEKIYEVILDDGSSVKCTGNHKFFMRDMSKKAAIDLKPGDSLMVASKCQTTDILNTIHYKQQKATILKASGSTYNHKIFSIRFIGIDMVYNGTVDDFHNYGIALSKKKTHSESNKLEMIFTVNCGEQTLESFELCCVTGDTRIQTKNSAPRISEVVNKEVKVWNGDRWSKVVPFLAAKDKEIYRVHISDGSYLDCTPDHKWHIKPSTARIFRSVETIDLKPGDYVVPFEIDREFGGIYEPNAFEYGLFSGDGYIDRAYPMVCICGEKSKLKDLDVKGTWYKEQIKEGLKEPYNRLNLKSVIDLELALLLNDKSSGLPDIVFSWDRESILEFIAGLIETDGNLCQQVNTDNYRIFGNVEKIRDLQILLRRVGINHSTIYSAGEAGEETNFGTRNYTIYCLYIPSYECREMPTRIKKAIHIGQRYAVNNRHPEGKLIDRARKQKIIKVEKLNKPQSVYCFTEPLNHMGVFGNVLTYQCLVETFPSRHESYEEYKNTLKSAYLYAKSVTLVNTHWQETNAVMLKNRRMGISQTGITVSLLPGVPPGIHYPHSEYYIRRIRISTNSDLIEPIKNAGYYIEDDSYSPNTIVVEFPVHEQLFERSKDDVSIWEQAENAADYQKYWSDNQVSITITFRQDEANQIKHVLECFEDKLKSVSFLPIKEHGYKQAPYESITKEKFEEMVSKLKPLDLDKTKDRAIGSKFCDSESCEIQL